MSAEDNLLNQVYQAAKTGDIAFLAQHRDVWDINVTMYAAMNGHLECLQFLYQNGCSWGGATCTRAAEYGKIECLKYAVENGCHFDDVTFIGTARSGQLKCLEYLFQQSQQRRKTVGTHQVCIHAIEFQQLECLQFVVSQHKNNLDINKLLWAAAAYNNLECFRYLYEVNCTLNTPTSGDEWWQNHAGFQYIQSRFKVNDLFDRINLDDAWWRQRLFHIQTKHHPYLFNRIKQKKREIQAQQQQCSNVLSSILPLDILSHILFCYF